jgi:hypothetical protein
MRSASDGLSTVPGQIALQRIPSPTKSAAIALVRPKTPALVMGRVTELDGQIDLRLAASHNRETLVFTQN